MTKCGECNRAAEPMGEFEGVTEYQILERDPEGRIIVALVCDGRLLCADCWASCRQEA